MTPIPDEFNYIAPKIASKLKKQPKKKEAKNVKMEAKSRYGNKKNSLKKDYVDLRTIP
jgi:hypothetical protein